MKQIKCSQSRKDKIMKKFLEFLKKVFTFIRIIKQKQREKLKAELKAEIKAELLDELTEHYDIYFHDELTNKIIDEITNAIKPKEEKKTKKTKAKITKSDENNGIIPEYYYE